ncbi:MAG TPA: pilus assembly protein PilM [Candidatus Paceibacterota bacterium]|nr:pilus assembly protein PilM [Verrucomicrobiota bacterium]HRY47765.1 pilus assembly protein PilM [Candidatus Paceibacterota bacterium]HSA01484.1 pilus assembly protein PilM [Candidatus Paceibacterota bacterium]
MELDLANRLASLIPRRCIAIDLGRSHIKTILAEKSSKGIRILNHQIVSLQEEGLLSSDEINQHLQLSIAACGNYPVILAIPQYQAISQVVEAPESDRAHLREFLEEESARLSGLSESAVIYDHQPLRPFGKSRNPIWVTVARESEVQLLVEKLAAGGVTVAAVTTSASALISSYLTTGLPADRVVLADLGATSTTVAILIQGQGVLVSSIPVGSESFTESIANLKRCSFEEAESVKQGQNLFQGDALLPGFVEVVDLWLRELEKLLREWIDDNTELEGKLQPLRVVLSGGGASQLGLLHYLHARSVFEFQPWPDHVSRDFGISPDRYAIAYGAVIEAFLPAGRRCSLLPQEQRRQRKRHDQMILVNSACLLLLTLLSAALLGGTIQKLFLSQTKTAMLADAKAALKKLQGIDALNHQRDVEYTKILPVLRRQKSTSDFFQMFEVMQQLRQKRDLWFVILADQASYFAGGTAASFDLSPTNFSERSLSSTNGSNPTNGYVLELCLNEKAEDRLKPLNELVAEMNKSGQFQKVDYLPAKMGTNIVHPKMILADRHFALSVELAGNRLYEPPSEPQIPSNATNQLTTPAPFSGRTAYVPAE